MSLRWQSSDVVENYTGELSLTLSRPRVGTVHTFRASREMSDAQVLIANNFDGFCPAERNNCFLINEQFLGTSS